MSSTAALPVLLVLALAAALGALRCLADRLLVSATIYSLLGAALAVAAGKAALDAL
jgi:hypothetical protein